MSLAQVTFADIENASITWDGQEAWLSMGGDYESVGLAARIEIEVACQPEPALADGTVPLRVDRIHAVHCVVDSEDFARAESKWGEEVARIALRQALIEQLAG